MRAEEGAHVETLPPAVQNQAAGLAVRFLPAIAENHFVAEAAATQKEVLVVFVEHSANLPQDSEGNNRWRALWSERFSKRSSA